MSTIHARSGQRIQLKLLSNPATSPVLSPKVACGKVYIKTHGCQMNVYDSQRIADLLSKEQGLELTDSPDEADVVLLNTCSVREKAQEKVFSQLGRWRVMRQTHGKDTLIAVGGCVGSQEGENILKRAPFVDIVFGPQTLHRLPELIRARRAQNRPQVDVSFPEIEKFDCLPQPSVHGPSAYVSIMEGCSKYCTFCVVPYTRGTEISRPFEDVLVEITQLVRDGVREVCLLGQNVNAYSGVMNAAGDTADLALLIRTIAHIPGLERIRFTTSHPLAFTDALIATYRDIPQLANHLHLPVQSGSNRILSAMKRGYTVEQFLQKLKKLRQVRPDIAISSDFIVGFPGETEDDFAQTLALIDDAQCDQSFSFIYSPRPGTPAAELPDDVSLEVKQSRLARLQLCLQKNAMRFSRAMVGSIQSILVEGLSQKNSTTCTGKTENMRSVHFTASPDLIGTFLTVRITEALPNCLRGEVVGIPKVR